MIVPAQRTQGRPLVFLGVVLSSWIVARALTWHGAEASAAPAPPPVTPPPPANTFAVAPIPVETMAPPGAPKSFQATRQIAPPERIHRSEATPPRMVRSHSARSAGLSLAAIFPTLPPSTTIAPPTVAIPWPERTPHPDEPRRPGRWSGDAWLLVRSGPVAPLGAGLAAPAYGASQAGAVIRYRLAPTSAHHPALYLRASGAAIAGGEREAALGLSLRAVPHFPVATLAELRVTHTAGVTRARPELALVSEFAPLSLPARVSVEVYGQGGWVGGAGATAFADGQARATRAVAKRGSMRLAFGAGAWGGVQKGAARVDLGPTAVLAVPLGTGSVRLAADWRFRVAGNAAPGSGPAATISAGF